MLSFMNINSKEREHTTNSTSTRRRKRSQETSGSLFSKLEVFIYMTSCCLYTNVMNNISRNFNLCDFLTQGYTRILYVILDLCKGYRFIIPVCFLYRLSRFPIHECLVILCIAYLSLCIFYKEVS